MKGASIPTLSELSKDSMSRIDMPHPLEQFVEPNRLARIDRVLGGRTDQFAVVLDGVHNDHNISAVVRSMEAFGVQQLYLVKSLVALSKGIALGTDRWISIAQHDTAGSAVTALRKSGFRLVVAEPERPADSGTAPVPQHAVQSLPYDEKLAFIFGNEKSGVSAELQEAADLSAYIPMWGFVESLNVSVACALVLYSCRIMTTGALRPVTLISGSKREALREEWLEKATTNGPAILRELKRRGCE